MIVRTITCGAVLALLATTPAAGQRLANASSGQKLQQATMTDVPRCFRKMGTLSIVDGDDSRAWTQYQLAAPQKLLKVLVQRSGCFNVVERGVGLQAAERERQIGGHLGLQRGSNVGQGQIKAADYVMIAELQGANSNVSGGGAGGLIGGLIGGRLGALAGGLRSKKMEANTVLSITNVRTTETMATTEGYAAKSNMAFMAGGGGFFGGGGMGAVGGGYDNTEIGRIVTLSFIQAYTNLVTELGLVRPGSTGTAEATPAKTFTTLRPVALRGTAAAAGRVIRSLPAGATVYPTGNKAGLWWEVADENDNVGWVLNTGLGPTQHAPDDEHGPRIVVKHKN